MRTKPMNGGGASGMWEGPQRPDSAVTTQRRRETKVPPTFQTRVVGTCAFLAMLLVSTGSIQAAPSTATEPAAPAPVAASAPRELAYKQQHVRERYEEVEQQLARLGELLATTDPDGAARVRAALKASRDGVVLSELQDVVQSLLENHTKTATERQSKVVDQIQRVLGVLQGHELTWEELQKQMANLQQLKEALQKLMEKQQALEKQSGQAMKEVAAGKQPDTTSMEKQKTDQAETRGETEKVAVDTKQPDKFPTDTVDPNALDKAAKHMQQAEQALQDRKPAEANSQQQQALEELQNTIGQVQARLEQEKAAQQERMLSELKDGIKSMLEKQKSVTTATADLNKELDPKKTPPRETTLKAVGLAVDEAGLAERSDGLTKKLLEDGTSAVFGQVLHNTAAMLRELEARLKKTQTGDSTPQTQKLVETNFQELLEALEEEQGRRAAEGGGGSGGGGGGKPMLLPPAAELKMLRMLQDRVNRATRTLDDDRSKHEKPTPQEVESGKQIAQREAEVSQTTEVLRNKWNEMSAGKGQPAPENANTDPLKDFLKKMQMDDKNPLTPIGKDMATVKVQLDDTVTGEPTQRVQTKIIRNLNDLIEQAQQAQQQSSAAQQQRRPQPGKKPEAGEKPGEAKSQPSSHAPVSNLTPGDGTKIGTLHKIYGGGDSDAWGKLPPEEREKFLQTLKEKFPDRYQEILTEYFKQLAQPKAPAAGGLPK